MLFLVRNLFGPTLLSDFLVILRTQFFFLYLILTSLRFSYDINNYFSWPPYKLLSFSVGYSPFFKYKSVFVFFFFTPLPLLLYTTLNSISFLSIHFISEVLQEERGGFFCYAVYIIKKETTGKVFDLTSDRILLLFEVQKTFVLFFFFGNFGYRECLCLKM